MDDAAEPCAPGNGKELNNATEDSESRLEGELQQVSADASLWRDGTDPRSGSREMERMESNVRLLAGLVKCLSGIRRGDQNRVRLALSEKKLELRSKVVAIECEKYNKEKAAQEELERRQRAEERRKKSGLSEKGRMHLLRGRLFDPEGVVKEREEELKRMQKDLKILKAKFGMSERSSGDGGQDDGQTEDGGSKMEDSKQPAPAEAGTSNCAPSGAEQIRVIPSPSDQSAVKEDGGLKMDDGAHPAPATGTPNGATGWREEAEDIRLRQGFRLHCVSTRQVDGTREAKKFDVEAALREVRQIKEELAALEAELPVSESSSGPLQDAESKVQSPKSNVASASAESEPEFSTLPPSSDYGATGSWEEQTQWLEKFPEAALRELERIKCELAVLKAERQVSSSGCSQENGS